MHRANVAESRGCKVIPGTLQGPSLYKFSNIFF